MRERGLALTFGALLLIVFAGILVVNDTTPAKLRDILLGRGPALATAPKPDAATPETTSQPVHKHNNRPTEAAQRAAATPVRPIFDIPVQVPQPLRENDVRPSMSRSELIERFGAPDLGAAWSDYGKLNEKLYYQRSASSAIEVLVQNGKVVSASTAN